MSSEEAPPELVRLAAPSWDWDDAPEADRAEWLAEATRLFETDGLLIVAGVLDRGRCDSLWTMLQQEIDQATPIERVMHERRRTASGYKIYNLQARRPEFRALVSIPHLVAFCQQQLGADMVLHSSEGAIIPAGGGESYSLHYDVRDRIPRFSLAVNTILYLRGCDGDDGATRYIPGTHVDFISPEEAATRTTYPICVEAGDAVVFSPYIWHKGGHNRSAIDRPAIVNLYARGFMKQEFDFPRQMGLSEIRSLTERELILFGFRSRVPLDLAELYFLSHAEVGDFDPIGQEFNHRFGHSQDGKGPKAGNFI